MEILPDQLLFVNKTARSTSLSHSQPEEKFYIQSYVHSRHRKQVRNPEKRARSAPIVTPLPEPSDLPTVLLDLRGLGRPAVAAFTANEKRHKGAQEGVGCGSQSSSPVWIPRVHFKGNAIDPFRCTSVVIDEWTYELLQYPFSDFIESIFKAESFSLATSPTSINKFRHRQAITERLQRCVVDELQMYATLAYCSSCTKWYVGKQFKRRPPEYYILETIKALRARLSSDKPGAVDSWLILAVYSLGVAALWDSNYETAVTHMLVVKELVDKIGGMRVLEPYVMESLLLGNKYLALNRLVPSILSLDWDPGQFPPDRMLEIRQVLCSKILNLGQDLLSLHTDVLDRDLLEVINDTVLYTQVSQYIRVPGNAQGADTERWLYLRHQALVYRLLALPVSPGIQECCRMAVLLWILSITIQLGNRAEKPLYHIMTRLSRDLADMHFYVDQKDLPLLFWITAVGALAADSSREPDAFTEPISIIAVRVAAEHDMIDFERVLERYLYLGSEQHVQLTRVLGRVQKMELGIMSQEQMGVASWDTIVDVGET